MKFLQFWKKARVSKNKISYNHQKIFSIFNLNLINQSTLCIPSPYPRPIPRPPATTSFTTQHQPNSKLAPVIAPADMCWACPSTLTTLSQVNSRFCNHHKHRCCKPAAATSISSRWSPKAHRRLPILCRHSNSRWPPEQNSSWRTINGQRRRRLLAVIRTALQRLHSRQFSSSITAGSSTTSNCSSHSKHPLSNIITIYYYTTFQGKENSM